MRSLRINNLSLKEYSFVFVPFLAKLFKGTIVRDYFPPKMKYTRIIPLHRSSTLKQPGYFRPIVFTGTISKAIEKLFHQKLYSFLKKFISWLITNSESGWKEAPSIHYQSWRCSQGKDYLKILVALFLSFRKAFDKVDQSLLLEKLHNYGITGNRIHLHESCQSNRYQNREVIANFSRMSLIDIGVPEASVLEQLLFLNYIYDISDHLFSKQMIKRSLTCSPKQSATQKH